VHLPETIPAEKRTLLAQLVAELRRVPGVLAVVLGGSYARGTQGPGSDLWQDVMVLAAGQYSPKFALKKNTTPGDSHLRQVYLL
jgi:predicted nucleotidyltransferase